MNPAQLLTHFDRISEAPDAIFSLRRFILDLAIRGKLVLQDPNDEPASELLNRIHMERARLVKAGKTRKHEKTPQIEDSELPFEVPAGWRWARLANISRRIHYGFTAPSNQSIKEVRLLRITDIQNNSVDWSSVPGCEISEREVEQYKLEQGDILIARTGGTIGKTFLVRQMPVTAVFASYLIRVQGSLEIYDQYLKLFMESPTYWKQLQDGARGGGQPNVNGQTLGQMTVTVPPLAEQQRIVAKVDELMALCDRLEAAQMERESRRDRLAAASLQRLNQPADAPAFREHARFHLRHLPRLTTRPQHIQQMRDTILQLAVTGRLSEQRSVDGNAQNLLCHLGRVQRRARKDLPFDAKDSSNPLPPLPRTWTWAIIDEVAAEEDNAITDGPFGANLKTAHYVETPGYRVIRLQNIGRGHFRMEHRSYIDKERFERLVKHWVFAGDLVVAGLVDPLMRCCEVPNDIGPALVKADCYRLKVHPYFSSRFALYYLNSPVCQRFAAAHHHGMTLVRIGLGNFRRIPIPIPPLAEQHRIVAKVDELMALCDRLEAQLTTAQTESRRLLEALLQEALNPAVESGDAARSHV